MEEAVLACSVQFCDVVDNWAHFSVTRLSGDRWLFSFLRSGARGRNGT